MNNFNSNDFRNYAVKHLGMNGLALDQYTSATAADIRSSYISPTIIEERQLNVAQMDVFSVRWLILSVSEKMLRKIFTQNRIRRSSRAV